ncbi:MAG TPA: cytochrome c biogenesis protein ResB [Thermomicrobiales bacterium]|nr:cytochrome c biogenesis protein ResB [Thermomicrobiales bacterium]
MTEIAIAKPKMNKRSPLEIGVDRVWRFFCSVRAAVWEVAILALLVLIGTLAGSEVPHWIGQLIPPAQGIIDRWYDWNVFRSLPFAFILGLLAVAIMICTLNRAPAMWQSISEPTVTTTHGFLNSAEVQLRQTVENSPAALTTDVIASLEAGRYRVLTEERNGQTHIYADRYRYGKLGTYPFHLALILILIGGIIGSRYGFRDTTFIVAEGATEAIGHGTGLSVQLNDFTDTYTELGQAHEYKSDLVILRDGEPVKSGSITVNNPISYRSTVVYQSSFGPAVNMKVTDAAGTTIYEGAIPVGIDTDTGFSLTAKGNPDAAAGYVDLLSIGKRLLVIAPDADPAKMPDLDKLQLRSGQMYVEMRDLTSGSVATTSDVVTQGVPTNLSGYTITFVRESQWSGLQVANNPGIPVFWLSAFMLIGGLAVVFYFPHRRIRGIVAPTADGGATALLAPIARRDWSARKTFEEFGQRLTHGSSGTWTLTIREDPVQLPETAADAAS